MSEAADELFLWRAARRTHQGDAGALPASFV
jgi:hypothetical protein